jgi:hypothetical protein
MYANTLSPHASPQARPTVLFCTISHVPSLLRNCEEFFFDEGIAPLFGALFAFSRLGAILSALVALPSPHFSATRGPASFVFSGQWGRFRLTFGRSPSAFGDERWRW